MNKKTKILIADDSAIYRKLVKRSIKDIDSIEIVGEAENGKIALDKIDNLAPDLAIVDINMPIMDGVEVLKRVKERSLKTEIIFLSSVSKESVKTTVNALNIGAFDFVSKPNYGSPQKNLNFLMIKLKNLITLYQTQQKLKGIVSKKSDTHNSFNKKLIKKRFDLIVIGISTGGPQTLNKIFTKIDKKIHTPIVIVQHMPPIFTKSLADSLDKKSLMNFKEAISGEELKSGSAYIAPGGKHLELDYVGGRIYTKITNKPPVNSCKPAVDILLWSMKKIVNYKNVLIMILTGMGRDGMQGVKDIKNYRTTIFAQDELSSIIFGMPKAIIDNNLQDSIVSVEEIIDYMNNL